MGVNYRFLSLAIFIYLLKLTIAYLEMLEIIFIYFWHDLVTSEHPSLVKSPVRFESMLHFQELGPYFIYKYFYRACLCKRTPCEAQIFKGISVTSKIFFFFQRTLGALLLLSMRHFQLFFTNSTRCPNICIFRHLNTCREAST